VQEVCLEIVGIIPVPLPAFSTAPLAPAGRIATLIFYSTVKLIMSFQEHRHALDFFGTTFRSLKIESDF
jgi:hypothetical protein